MPFEVQPTQPHAYREELAGCVNGTTTYKSVFYCDPSLGPVDGTGTDTESVSYFYTINAGATTVLDWATASAAWKPGACVEPEQFAVGVITNPDDPEAADTPVVVTVNPDGSIDYTSLLDGSIVTPGAGEEFRTNADGYRITRDTQCIRDANNVVTGSVEVVVVTDEDAEEVSRRLVDPADGSVITLAAGETVGPCAEIVLPSENECGCLVDEVAGTARPVDREIQYDITTGALDRSTTKYYDDAGEVTPGADEKYHCGPCGKIITCA